MSPETPVLDVQGVRLGLHATSKEDALNQCGVVLVEIGACSEEYARALHEREASVSTFMGEGVAIPHGTDASRVHITRTALAFLQFPDGVNWDGNDCRICIAIASQGHEHIGLLQSLAMVLSDPDSAAALRSATTAETVLALLAP